MQEPVVRGIKRLIERRSEDITFLSLSWFGGEPLLARSVVEEIGSFAHRICHNKGIDFVAGFTTNGYLLTPDLFKSLLAISHREYQITLDGDEEWHDKTRLLANRRPTFERIWSHLLAYKQIEGNFAITLRLHVHRDNLDSLRRLYRRLQVHILDDARFSVYFHKISNLNPNYRVEEGVLSRTEYLEAISYIREHCEQDVSDRPISEEHLNGYICYAAKPNSLMIRADGRLGKCTVALHDNRNHIGRIREDGRLEVNNERLQKWFKGYEDLSPAVLGCPLSMLNS